MSEKKSNKQIVGGFAVKQVGPVVCNCKNYKVGEYLKKFNRDVTITHVNSLKRKLKRRGFIGVVILLKTKAFGGVYKFIYADAQHRVMACEQLDIPFNYMIYELYEDTPLNVTLFIADLNNSSLNWSPNMYLDKFAANNIANYKIVLKEKKRTAFTVTDFLHMFSGGAGKYENDEFKNGTMKFIDYKDSVLLLKAMFHVKEYVPNKAFVRRQLVMKLRVSKDYMKFAKAIKEASVCLKNASTCFSENEKEFAKHLDNIYQDTFSKKVAKAA